MQDASEGKRLTSERSPSTVDEESATLQAAAAIFGDLVDDMGPPLSALSQSCTTALGHLRDALQQTSGNALSDLYESENLFQLSEDVQRALFTFESTSNQVLSRRRLALYALGCVVFGSTCFEQLVDYASRHSESCVMERMIPKSTALFKFHRGSDLFSCLSLLLNA